VRREQELLLAHDLIVLQHPLYWYSTPPLVKQWIDLVLEYGWAYGEHGIALRGKRLLSVISAGGSESSYGRSGIASLPGGELPRRSSRRPDSAASSCCRPSCYGTTTSMQRRSRVADEYGRLLAALQATVASISKRRARCRASTSISSAARVTGGGAQMGERDFFYQAFVYLAAAVVSVPIAATRPRIGAPPPDRRRRDRTFDSARRHRGTRRPALASSAW
jgi:hypothetical protein